jgi:NhaA family Na+:H+ antiporter
VVDADRPTFITSQRLLARAIARPVARFLAVEASGGLLLLLAAAVALVWANSPWRASYEAVWHTDIVFGAGRYVVVEDLRHWVNDGLMALFFFVVGLEIRQEMVHGFLADRRDAALPVVAALGGMVVPAAIYALCNLGSDGAAGWGIPMATDIAFALGVIALLGSRVPPVFKVVLLALAIVDDLGAIAVIAVFYTDDLELWWALAAIGGLVVVRLLRQVRVWYLPIYVVVGIATWWCTLQSGVHATIAGVALGLLAPARPLMSEVDADRIADELSTDADVGAEDVRRISFRIRESVPVGERLQELLHPWTSYVVIPVFALANAGIELSGSSLRNGATSAVTIGVVLGLVVGKFVGVAGAIAIATRLGIARLPAELTRRHIAGLAAVAGVGFTVSLFITGLAFDEPQLADEAKIGVLVASVVAALIAIAVLASADRDAARRSNVD